MSAYLLGPALGLGVLTLILAIAEGLALTLVIALVVERFLLPLPVRGSEQGEEARPASPTEWLSS